MRPRRGEASGVGVNIQTWYCSLFFGQCGRRKTRRLLIGWMMWIGLMFLITNGSKHLIFLLLGHSLRSMENLEELIDKLIDFKLFYTWVGTLLVPILIYHFILFILKKKKDVYVSYSIINTRKITFLFFLTRAIFSLSFFIFCFIFYYNSNINTSKHSVLNINTKIWIRICFHWTYKA